MALSTFWAVVFATAFFLNGGSVIAPRHIAESASNHQTITPKWHIDLRSTIGNVAVGRTFGRAKEYKALPRTSLWFIDNDTIVASFVTYEGKENPRLSTRGGSETNVRIYLIFLDAASGKVTDSTDWPSESRNAGIIATRAGKFIIQSGIDLTLYGPDLKLLKNMKLPALAEGDWMPHASPTGRNILFVATGRRAVPWLWLETESLQILHSWEDTQNGEIAITDDKIAMVSCSWSHECEPKVEIRGTTTDWKTIAPGTRRSFPEYVTEDLLFLLSNPSRLIRTDGTVIFVEETDSKSCWWGRASPSIGGERFAVPACSLEGAVGGLDVEGGAVLKTIFLYDRPFNKRTYTLEVHGPKIVNLSLMALSPDGSLLAVLNNESVETFQMPRLP
jgi:hypothetical protein